MAPDFTSDWTHSSSSYWRPLSCTYYAAFHWFTKIIPDLRVRVLYPAGTVEFRERFFCLRIPRWSRNRWKAKT
jgi:hypothetical protein